MSCGVFYPVFYREIDEVLEEGWKGDGCGEVLSDLGFELRRTGLGCEKVEFGQMVRIFRHVS